MASCMRSSSCFGRLPNNVLQRIETSLDVKDRLAFFSCCQAVRAYQTAAPGGLWPELKFKLRNMKQAQAVAAWLARNRQHLGKLTLKAGSRRLLHELAQSLGYRAAMIQLAAEAAQCIMTVLPALAGSTLHTLSVDVHNAFADIQIGSWVLCLPQLESLSMEAGDLSIWVDLSQLTRLTSLSLWQAGSVSQGSGLCGPLKLATPGMPPRLRELEIFHFDAGAFRECASAAEALPQLQDFKVQWPSADWVSVLPWDWLLLRRALTGITLSKWEPMESLPAHLAALAGLQQFAAIQCSLPATDEAVQPLSALTGLTNLAVSGDGWQNIPASVFALPSLKELCVIYDDHDLLAGVVEPDPPLAGSSSLTMLNLRAGVALGAAQQLACFPALQVLCLESYTEHLFEGDEAHEAVGRLLGELKRLPRFVELNVGHVKHPAFRRFVRLLRVANLEYPFKISTSRFANIHMLNPDARYDSDSDLDLQEWSDVE